MATKEQIWNDWKCRPCAKCGQRFHPCQIDAHHIDADSKENDHRFSIKSLPKEGMIAELDKCIPLCKNCHALHHWGETQIERKPYEEGRSCPWPREFRSLGSKKDVLDEETQEILRRWRGGESYHQIGQSLGICGKTAKRIVNKYKRL